MPTTALTPEALDLEAARLLKTINWPTAPNPTDYTPAPAREPLTAAVPGLLVSKTLAQLEAEAGITHGPAPRDHQLPGRIAAVLPDRLHTWRRAFMPELKPSVQLGYARQLLEDWGWQNTPYRLRNAHGARCVCGAILTVSRLGYGSQATAHRSAAYVLGELRAQGWDGLIGPWNRQSGRTAEQATGLISAAAHRAAQAGH